MDIFLICPFFTIYNTTILVCLVLYYTKVYNTYKIGMFYSAKIYNTYKFNRF